MIEDLNPALLWKAKTTRVKDKIRYKSAILSFFSQDETFLSARQIMYWWGHTNIFYFPVLVNFNTPADHESQVISSEIGSELETWGQEKFEFQNAYSEKVVAKIPLKLIPLVQVEILCKSLDTE